MIFYLIMSALLAFVVVYFFRKNSSVRTRTWLQENYLVGLNFLLNDETDKAIEIFVKTLEGNPEAVETHLALGNLFRRRGEVDRAIRIHQNLIAQPQLENLVRVQALLALGQDYLSAGVLDRAERIFLDEMYSGDDRTISFRCLLDIYQQERDWEKAIQVALKLSSLTEHMQLVIAQHYCELAALAEPKHAHKALQYLKRALAYDSQCARANLMQGEIYAKMGRYKEAIKYLQRIKKQAPEYLDETLVTLGTCFDKIGETPFFIEYLRQCLSEHPSLQLIRTIAVNVEKTQGHREAVHFVAECARRYPSMWSVHLLIEFNLRMAEGRAKSDLLILQGLVEKILSEKSHYLCENCGMTSNALEWQCRRCKHWSVMKPVSV